MKEIVRLPQWGDEMTEGEVGECYVQCGDHVDKGDALVAIEIDKTSVEIESPVSGRVLSIETEVGKIVPVGSVLAEIETE
mgnify:FL=1|jgi:pyruvate/2-oxoglutarate dehydrogenase complex dihydrolipoamide acyltransferase (E2) component|tara:strand:+ start:65 stop:304 length:240 start_codon:yes stop_codon:yes gene_type:complete